MALRIGSSIGITSASGGGAYSSFVAGINGNPFAPLFAHGDGGLGDATFLSGADGPAVFPRQPVLVRAGNGDILAFAQLHEGSVQATGDKGISAIQMRRSNNNGTGSAFNGSMKNVAIWTGETLTAQEIQNWCTFGAAY